MKTLRNWPEVVYALATRKRGDIKLVFKSGEEVHCRNSWAAYGVVEYYALAEFWGADPELETIQHVAADIEEKIGKAVSDGLLSYRGVGGGVGFTVLAGYLLIRLLKPQTVVETGVAQGASSYFFLKALDQNGAGKLISIDYPNRDPEGYRYDDKVDSVYVPRELSPGWLVPDSLRTRWTLRLGRSSDVLPTLDTKIQMFHHDSEHSYKNMMFEYEWALQHVEKGGVIMSDDIGWSNAFQDFLGTHKAELRPPHPDTKHPTS